MTVTIYVDELIFINMFVTFFLLLSSSVFSSSRIRPVRMLLSCFVGGLYSLILLFPPIHFLLSLLLRITVCTVIVLICDSFSSVRIFFKRICTFFIMNFVFAGFMLAVNIFLTPKNIIYSSGALYYDIGLTFIIILSVLSYISVFILSKLTSSKHIPDCLFGAEIHINSSLVKGKAFLDTGNSVSDVFTGKPVVLAEKKLVLPIVPDEVKLFLSGVSPEKLSLSEKQKTNIRLIPFSSVGGSGLLPSVKCDKLTLHVEGQEIHIPDILVAVTDKPLSTGEFNILLPNSLSQYIKRSSRNEKHLIKR